MSPGVLPSVSFTTETIHKSGLFGKGWLRFSVMNQTTAGPVTAAHAQWVIVLTAAILLTQIIALVFLL